MHHGCTRSFRILQVKPEQIFRFLLLTRDTERNLRLPGDLQVPLPLPLPLLFRLFRFCFFSAFVLFVTSCRGRRCSRLFLRKCLQRRPHAAVRGALLALYLHRFTRVLFSQCVFVTCFSDTLRRASSPSASTATCLCTAACTSHPSLPSPSVFLQHVMSRASPRFFEFLAQVQRRRRFSR
jgi:hypothetical protein